MFEGELRKYNEGELSAYFKGADRLYWDLRDFIEKNMKKKINKFYLLTGLELAYMEWERYQNDFGLSEVDEKLDEFDIDLNDYDIPDDFF